MELLTDSAAEIISAIRREEIDETIASYIAEADSFLLESTNDTEPSFLNHFFEKTKEILTITVDGCIKSRNNSKTKDDLKKYKEGYFNEIIQNANDVAIRAEKENPEIDIRCIKHSETNEYEVICSYPDKGFSLTDIYGFCSRGNSNKLVGKGKEGMYGIGIKSLFCFATYFCIENNVKIELSSSNGKMLNNTSIIYLNKFPKKTVLTFRFQYNEAIENKHAGFNVKKLAGFIDALVAGEACENFFYSEDEKQTLFDARALIFTELRNNRKIENSIKKIIFTGNNEIFELKVLDKIYNDHSTIKISQLSDDMNYLVFHYPKEDDEKSLSLAYRINADWSELRDRIYATYFVASSSSLLERNTGCLVNTKAINSSRSGLERDSEAEPAILTEIKEKGKKTISDLIGILGNDQVNEEWKKASGDVLCQLLDIYKYSQIIEEDSLLPTGIFSGKVEELKDVFTQNKLFSNSGNMYIFKQAESDDIDNAGQIIVKNKPVNANIENCKSLYRLYETIFISKDTILFESDTFEELPFGIRKLVESKFSNYSGWLDGIGLPFIQGAKNLIRTRIGGNNFSEIMDFIKDFTDGKRQLVKQLIARFEVNNSFDYMGDYSHNNVVNWLFSNDIYDKEFALKCKEYEDSYGALKKLVKPYIQLTNYHHSSHWNASDDLWYRNFKSNTFNNLTIYLNQIQQFLSLLSKNVFRFGYNLDNGTLFVHNHNSKSRIYLRNNSTNSNGYPVERKRSSNIWKKKDKFEFFTIDFLERSILDFESFKLFRQMIDKYNNQISDNRFKIDAPNSCKLENVDLTLLEDMFKWLSTYEENIKFNINKLNIEPQNTSLTAFAKLFLKNVNIRLEKINAGKDGAKFIGYITNLNTKHYEIKCRKSVGSKEFRRFSLDFVFQAQEDNTKNLVIFYSNSDEQTALSAVLKDLGIGNELPSYINHFVNTDNVKQLSSSDYEKYLNRVEMSYKYPFEDEKVVSFLDNSERLEMEEVYTVLSGELSYQSHCPICNDIPTLNIKGDERVSASKNCLVIILPALYEDKKIYVKTICCKSCFEEYKVSLTEAKVIKENEQHILELKSTLCDSTRSYDFIKRIPISPDNWKIVQDFMRAD